MFDETEMKSRASSGENLRRQSRHPKLHHSRSDDNRRRSFDKHPKDPQSSRHSLNTQAVMGGSGTDCEPKYFTTVSLDTEESRGDNSDESHVVDIDEANHSAVSSEGPTEGDMLLEEPELENVTEIDVESSGDDLDDEKCESRRSASEKTDPTVLGQNPIIIADDMDSQTIVEEVAHNSGQIEHNEIYETTLYIEDDEV